MNVDRWLATSLNGALVAGLSYALIREARRARVGELPSSLRRHARAEALVRLGGRLSRRWIMSLARRGLYGGRRFLQLRRAPVLLLAVIVSLAWVPVPLGLFGMSEQEATTFLGVLWQALAGAVGLSVAVMLFALQSVSAARSLSLAELATRSGLLVIVYLGVGALLDVGVALLPLHHAGADGWPGLLATIVSGVTIAAVALVFLTSLRLTEPRVLRHHRVADLQLEARNRVGRSVTGRVATEFLRARTNDLGIDYERWMPYTNHGLVGVVANRDGVLRDIKLRRLRAAVASHVGSDAKVRPVLVTSVGEQIAEGSPLLLVPPGGSDRALRRARRAFVVRRGAKELDGLTDTAAALHQEALEAIRESRPARFLEVREAQEELLLAFPKAWRETGFAFEDDAESGAFGLTGPISTVRQNMYEQAIRAAASEEREIGFRAAGSPYAVAADAWELGALTLMSSMLELLVSVFDSTSRYRSPHFGVLMHETVQRHLLDFLDYRLCRHLDDDEASTLTVDASLLWRAISFSQARVASVMRINVENRDTELLRSGLRHWNQVLEYSSPRDPSIVDLQRRVGQHRSGCMVAISAWALRNTRDDQYGRESSRLLDVVSSFTRWEAGDDPEVFRTADSLLSDWIGDEMPERVTFSVDSQTPLLRYVAFALLAAKQPAILSASRWIQDRQDGLRRAITELSESDDLWLALDREAPNAASLQRAVDAVNTAVRRYEDQEAERLRATPLPAAAKSSITANVRQGWESTRWLSDWLKARGLVPSVPEPIPAESLGIDDLILKSFFLDESFVGIEQSLQHMGRALAVGELKNLVDVLARVPVSRGPRRASLRARIEEACRALGERDLSPVVFAPINWRLRDEIGIGFQRGGELDGVSIGHALAGYVGTIPVVELNRLPRIVVADPTRLVHFEAWKIEGWDLRVRVTEFDQEAAERQVRQSPALMRDEKHRSVDERAAKLRTCVWVTAHEGFRLSVADANAGIPIPIPRDIEREG